MKKTALLFVLSLALLLAACGSAAPASPQDSAQPEAEEIIVEETEAAPVSEDGQNPVMNFVGTYSAGRPFIEVSCEGAENARFLVTWSSSAWEHSEWTMSGRLDPDTLTVDYSNCVRKDVVFNEDGSSSTSTVVYQNGSGRITFLADRNALTWEDQQEHMADDLVFEFAMSSEDPSYYSAFTAMDKTALENAAWEIRNLYLEEDWSALADRCRFPVLVNGTSYADREAFLAFMSGCTLSESARAEMEAEFCHDMFYNGQGLCMGSGQIWLLDPSYMTENPPELRIISFNDIAAK